jgi:nucleotide-binding universal stress UspA family protein
MMIKVLIPTDYSDYSTQAFIFTLRIFKSQAIQCHFVHAYNPNITLADEVGSGMDHELFADKSLALEAEMKEWSKPLVSQLKEDDQLSCSVEIGSLTEVLENKTKAGDFHFIIMGTQGATGAKEIFLGSNTVSAIKKIRTIPVIAVPESIELNGLGKVVIATAFKYEFTENNLKSLMLLHRLWSFQLDIIKVNEGHQGLSASEQKIKDDLLLLLNTVNTAYVELKKTAKVSDAIVDYALNHKSDLIALHYKRHSFLERLFREPVVKKVAFSSMVPLLVFPN